MRLWERIFGGRKPGDEASAEKIETTPEIPEPAAANELAIVLKTPDGDLDVAATKLLAEAGNAGNQYLLGSYYRSNGNFDAAELWLRKAAAVNIPGAIFELGMLYLRSDPAHEDAAKAHDLFYQGLRAKDGMAAANLGMMYANGVGVEQSLAKAFGFFLIATDLGNVDAEAWSEQIKGRLSQADKNIAEKFLRKLGAELNLF